MSTPPKTWLSYRRQPDDPRRTSGVTHLASVSNASRSAALTSLARPVGDTACVVAVPDGPSKLPKAQGIEVKDRGRMPAELVVKLEAATAK